MYMMPKGLTWFQLITVNMSVAVVKYCTPITVPLLQYVGMR